jgi:hypothetical protein
VRPHLGALAETVVKRRAYEGLGFRCLGDWSRERIGVGARAVGEWARVWRALRELPRLRAAVLVGEVSWTVARRIVGIATPENEAACLETVRGRSVRAVEAVLEALRAVEEPGGARDAPDDEERVRVRIECSRRLATKWAAAVELARRVSGEALSTWEAAEAIAAEAASAIGAPEVEKDASDERSFSRSRPPRAETSECGLRAVRWPWLRWAGPSDTLDTESVETDLADTPPLELDRQFRQAVAFLQRVDFEIGRILRQILERALYRELGFESFEDYVVERLDLSPRTARRLARLARAPEAVATAFREGRITLLAAEAILRGAPLDETVTLRRLPGPGALRDPLLRAPGRLAGSRRTCPRTSGGPLALRRPEGRNLSAEGGQGCAGRSLTCTVTQRWQRIPPLPIEASSTAAQRAAGERSKTGSTLCAWHHQRGAHGTGLKVRGRAPDDLVFELGVGRFRSGDRRIAD